MKASQFSDAAKAFILKQGDGGVPVAEFCRKAGISRKRQGDPIWRRGGRSDIGSARCEPK